jgi:hypothetical protein
MPAPHSYDYALIRVVPRPEREEFINVGAILFCRTMRFLGAQLALDHARLRALAPTLDLPAVERYLEIIPRICAGKPDGGPLGLLSQSERFHLLVILRSTVVQASPVHCGLCENPAAALEHLVETLVRVPG